LLVSGGADLLGELVDFGDDGGDFVQSAPDRCRVQSLFDDARAALHVFDGLTRLTLNALNEVGNFPWWIA